MRIYLFVAIFAFPLTAMAWGPSGQAITVKIAEAFLTKSAAQKLSAITGGRPLSEFASWADMARNTPEWSQSSTWHYVNMDKSLWDQQPQDILQALEYVETELSGPNSNEEKLIWVKFIIHFVGDLHQPLHSAKSSDRGGNSVTVRFKGRKTNLHALWDGALLQTTGLGVEEYSQKLIQMRMGQELLSKKFDPLEVVSENSELLDFIYSFQGTDIDQTYATQALELTDKRLWAGGLRLASLLNELFR